MSANDMENASKNLAKGTAVYLIGNFLSKLLQILILPLVTAVLLDEEYGYYDLVITSISLVTPLFTLQLVEAMFRFLYDADELEKRRTLSTVCAFLVVGVLVLSFSIFIAARIFPGLRFPVLIFLSYAFSIVYSYLQKVARVEKKNAQFAVSGLIYTMVLLGTQALTLLVLRMKTDGLLLSNALAYLAASIYLNGSLRVERRLFLKAVDWSRAKKLMLYSLPLIPNSICWWLISDCNRYVISFFLGVSANGIYSIANKFPQLITFATSVFQLAWQESAISVGDHQSRDSFYTKVFNRYVSLLMGSYLVFLPMIRLVMPILVAGDFRMGYVYVPMLLLGAVFSAIAQFYGGIYLVIKNTKAALRTTLLASVVNCILSVALTPVLGLHGPATATAIAFLVLWIVCARNLSSSIQVKVDKKRLALLSALAMAFTFAYYLDDMFIQAALFAAGTVILLAMNWPLVTSVTQYGKQPFHRLRGESKITNNDLGGL